MSRADNPRATLDAVAARAGVSKATASKVLNGRPGVSEETRRRVREAIEALGYVPSTGPREPVARGAIVAVFDTIVNMYSLYILEGIIDGGRQFGVDVIADTLTAPGESATRHLGIDRIKEAASRGCTGLVVVTSQLTHEEIEACERAGLSLVAIDPLNPLDEAVFSVGSTNWAGGVQATKHLIDLGHRRIAFAGGRADSSAARERLHGYREALEAAGLQADPTLAAHDDFLAESGERLAQRLLDQDGPPTAVCAASDAVALGVIREAKARGLRVPEDLSVVGFDDTYAAMWTDPPLTTVRQPLGQMGRVAARTVLDLADGKEPDSHHVQLATTLVVRDSTAPPANH
jgi:LacI family transcriptional regulator